MSLSETQQASIREWVQAGASISDVQKRIQSDFDLRMTFMDVRMLLLDLDAELQEEEKVVVEPKVEAKAAGGVSVEVDRLVQPGALASGDVSFSDGVTAKWMLGQDGRLALEASKEGYQPIQEDVQEFQNQLREKLKHMGM